MSDIGLTHVALPVRSLVASVAFYGKYASMHTVHQRPGVVWVSDRTRPFALVLIETSNEIKPLLPMAHLGVGVRSREEVGRLCQLAREDQCLAREPEDSGPPVGYWGLIRDPDGHTLEVAYGQELGSAVQGGANGLLPMVQEQADTIQRLSGRYVYVWEFKVLPEREKEFLAAYGSSGAWSLLFRKAAGYVETLLLQDQAVPTRFLTIDRWSSQNAHDAFLIAFRAEYEALDRACESLTQDESGLGSYWELIHPGV